MTDDLNQALRNIVQADPEVIESLDDGVIKKEIQRVRELWDRVKEGREDTMGVSC